MGSLTLLRVIEIVLAAFLTFYAVLILCPGGALKDLHAEGVKESDSFCTKEHFPLSSLTGYVPNSATFRKFMAILDLVAAFYLLFGKSYMKTYFTVAFAVLSSYYVMFLLNINAPPERTVPSIVFFTLVFLRLVLVRNEVKDHLHID